MLLPTVTEFSLEPALERYADCARAIGWAGAGDNDNKAASKLIDGLYAYNERLDVPSMSSFGIDQTAFEEALDQMAEDALRSGAPNYNPRVPDKQEIKDLYVKAWSMN